MKVAIKTFDVQMQLGNNGIELSIDKPAGGHLGDLVVTKTILEWCDGQTHRGNGVKVDWAEFIEWMNS